MKTCAACHRALPTRRASRRRFCSRRCALNAIRQSPWYRANHSFILRGRMEQLRADGRLGPALTRKEVADA